MDFYADGCPACEETKPIISDMEKEFINKTVFITHRLLPESPGSFGFEHYR